MSKILARAMLHQPFQGKRILEIGCGIALPSIVLKHLGGDITASDYHPLAQPFLIENASLNSLDPIHFKPGDWNAENTNLGQFDLIIGSDVLYEPQHIELLSSFINDHSSSQVDVVIVDPGRGSHRAFAREMERLEYLHTWTDLTDYPIEGIKPKGLILYFSRHH
jgi:predicted nicotinamide N-methyase